MCSRSVSPCDSPKPGWLTADGAPAAHSIGNPFGKIPNKFLGAPDVTLDRQNLSIFTTRGILFGRGRSGPGHMELYIAENKPSTWCAVKVHNCSLLVVPLQYITAYPARDTNTDSGANCS